MWTLWGWIPAIKLPIEPQCKIAKNEFPEKTEIWCGKKCPSEPDELHKQYDWKKLAWPKLKQLQIEM